MSATATTAASSPPSSKGKGKLKDFSSDFDDPNPVITYRHVLSPIIGVKHPLRVVALCDCNAFYANCEQVRLGIDPETPLVVLQWGMLIAVNYPARKFGISRMDKVDEAKKRCPNLVVVHVATYAEGDAEPVYRQNPDMKTHKVSLDHYRRESMKIITLFKQTLPTGEVEKASIDEAFIDFSVPVRDILLQRYPYLAQVPADGQDTQVPSPPPSVKWDSLGNLVPIDPSKLGPDQEPTIDVLAEHEQDIPVTWHDVCLSIAAELMAKMRSEVHSQLGYLTSAGISRNKFLAKLAASYRKFNTQNILRNAAIPGFLKPMPFQKIRFLGGKLGKALANEYDVSTVGDLLNISLDEMQNKFGESAIWVYEILRGIDRAEVKEKAVINKSMNASKNLPKPITKYSDGPQWIRMLAAELALRLNEAREQTPGLWPKTVVLHVRQGWATLRSKQIPFPPPPDPHTPVTVDLVAGEGEKLWKEIILNDMIFNGGGKVREWKITNLNLAFTGVHWTEEGQKSIEGFFNPQKIVGLRSASEDPSDNLRSPKKRKRSLSASPSKAKANSSLIDLTEDQGEISHYECERCGKRISVVPQIEAQLHEVASDEDFNIDLESIRQKAFEMTKLEHSDFHFAQDLSRAKDDAIATVKPNSKTKIKPSSRSASSSKPTSSPPRKKKKRASEPEGIAKFFIKREKS